VASQQGSDIHVCDLLVKVQRFMGSRFRGSCGLW
jgi:hypothetical protein